MNLARKLIEKFTPLDVTLMSNVLKGQYGQPLSLRIDPYASDRSYEPRIEVQSNYNLRLEPVHKGNYFSVSISDNPKVVAGSTGEIKDSDIELIFKFVKLNKDVLLEYGTATMSDLILIKKLKSI